MTRNKSEESIIIQLDTGARLTKEIIFQRVLLSNHFKPEKSRSLNMNNAETIC
jgi:hypothetical protein